MNDFAYDSMVADVVNLTAGAVNINVEQLRILLNEEIGAMNGKISASETTLRGEITASAKQLTVDYQAADSAQKTVLEGKITASASALTTAYQNADKGLQSQITQQAGSIQSVVSDVSDLDGKVSGYNSRITQNANKISAIVSNVGSGGTVTAASIVASINSAGSSVKISADHVNITGFVTFSDLSTSGYTTINADNITTGSISANRISGGTLEGVILKSTGSNNEEITISNGVIDFYSGSISDGDYGYLNVSATVLQLTGSSGVNISAKRGTGLTIYAGSSEFGFSSSGLYWTDAGGRTRWAAFN